MSVCDEHLLQYARPGQSGECDLVIGLDFGTSASKIVIQAPDLPGRPGYAVDFGEYSHETMPYLLPTRLWVTPSGACALGPCDGARLVNDIKLELFSGDEHLNSNRGPTRQGLHSEAAAVAYLALLLRRARKWFLETKRDIVGHFGRLNWSVNLGVPSPCIEDNEENGRFRRVGKAAWMLSALAEEHITLRRACVELEHVDDPEYWENDTIACDFDIIPEIAGGAVGYALSNLRREGLHVMVDIGASTVDVCSFILHAREGNDRYSLLTADVQILGTIRLHHERIVALKRAYERQADDLRDRHDPLVPLAEDIEPYLISREQLIPALTQAEAQLKEQFQKMLRRVIWEARVRRNPDDSVWRQNGRLPILLIGGGSKLQFFRSAVEELDAWLRSNTSNDGTVLLPVPVPDSLGNRTDEYQRLAVA